MRKNSINMLVTLFVAAVIAVALAPASALAQTQTIVYVDADSTNVAAPSSTNPGNAWTGSTGAYKYLQNGIKRANDLLDANPNIPVAVWVAEGTYRPDQGSTVTLNGESESFRLRDNMAILGGFVGGVSGETDYQQRNPLVNITILSGEIGSAGLSDNTYHIVTSIRNQASASIDGFTIRDGNASGETNAVNRVGAGAIILGLDAPDPTNTLDLESSQPGIVRCIFENCHARFGGAVYVHVDQESAPLIANCEFRENIAYKGGAMYVEGVSGIVGGPDVVNSLFVDNTADFDSGVSGSGNGGAVYVQAVGVTRIINCTLTQNIAEGSGAGGIHHDGPCQTPPARPAGPDVISTILWDNESPQLFGGNETSFSCVDGLEGVCTDHDNAVIDDDPEFVSGTNFRLTSGSPCIDTGYSPTIEILGDPFDIDQNGSLGDAMADLDGRRRIIGAFSTAQDCRVVDMGTYEFGAGGCTGDVVPDGVVNIDDLLAVIGGWGPCPSAPTLCPGDIAPSPCGDGEVNIDDLLAVISGWGNCPGVVPATGGIASIPEDFWDCWNACSQAQNFGECMDDCFEALCKLGHTEYCE